MLHIYKHIYIYVHMYTCTYVYHIRYTIYVYVYICIYTYVYEYICIYVPESQVSNATPDTMKDTEWLSPTQWVKVVNKHLSCLFSWRLIGSSKLQIIFHKRATKYRSRLWKMTYKDKGSYESSPPCIYNFCLLESLIVRDTAWLSLWGSSISRLLKIIGLFCRWSSLW